MANCGIPWNHVRRAAMLAAGIEVGASGLVLRPGVSDAQAGRVAAAARSVMRHLAAQHETGAEPVETDLRAAAAAAMELVRALHVLAVEHPCAAARRQVRLAGMLHVMIAELGARPGSGAGTPSGPGTP